MPRRFTGAGAARGAVIADPAGRRKPSRSARLALAAFGLLLALLAGEAAVRFFSPEIDLYDRSDPILGFRFRPGLRATVPSIDGTPTPLAFNSLGFRDAEPSRIGRPIVLLGDSFLAGVDVPFAKTFAGLLKARFARASPPFEVLSMGVPGYDTGQELLTLEHVALPLSPSAVVVCFYVENDVWDNSPELSRLPHPQFTLDGGAPRPLPFRPMGDRIGYALLNRSQLYRWQKRRINALLERARGGLDPLYGIYRASPGPKFERAWTLTAALLARAAGVTRGAGGRFFVAVIPGPAQVDDGLWAQLIALAGSPAGLDREAPQERLAAIAREQGLTLIDLLAPLRAAAARGERVYHGHLTAAGHAVAAAAIGAALAAR